MKQFFHWLRQNIMVFLIIAIIIWGIRGIVGINQNGYKDEIKAKSDSIALLKDQYDSLNNREATALELLSASRSSITSLQDSLTKSKIDIIIQKKHHAKQIEKFELITTAEHYIDYIRWIDTVSFE